MDNFHKRGRRLLLKVRRTPSFDSRNFNHKIQHRDRDKYLLNSSRQRPSSTSSPVYLEIPRNFRNNSKQPQKALRAVSHDGCSSSWQG
jgi:hypothetical protein